MAVVAQACVLGIPGEPLLHGDTVEQLYWQAAYVEAAAFDATRRDNQAQATANAVAALFKRGRRRAR